MNELTNRFTLTSLIDENFFSPIYSRISFINWFLRLIVMFYADIIKHLLFIYLVPIHTCLQITTKIITPKSSTSITRGSILDPFLGLSFRLYICAYPRILLTAEPIWFSPIVKLLRGSRKAYTFFLGRYRQVPKIIFHKTK